MRGHAFRGVFSRALVATIAALLCTSAVVADSPADALKTVADAAAALVNDDAPGFLDQFDRDMPGYAALSELVQGLLNTSTVGSTVDVISSAGDDRKQMLELDWVLVIGAKSSATGGQETRRGVVKCTVERKGRAWKITGLDPVEFFRQ